MHIHHHGQAPAPPIRLLPQGARRFIGRDAELSQLVDWLNPQQNPAPLVNVFDGPGAGKTALAVRAAQLAAEHFPGPQLFMEVNRAGEPEPDAGEVLRRALHMLRLPDSRIPEGLVDRSDVFHSELPERALLVLDNVRSSDQIRPLLPGRPGYGVVITSRRSLSELEGIQEMDLEAMPPQEAYALLEERIGTQRITSDPASAQEIVRLCGALPLALHIVGAQLAKPAAKRLPVAKFAARLADERTRLDLLKCDHLDVRASFSLSYQGLTAAAARHFRLLSLLDVPDFSDDLAAEVVTGEDADVTLGELLNAHLLEPVGDDRLRFHDLVKVFARERAYDEDSDAERAAAVEQGLRWCVRASAGLGAHVGVDGRHDPDPDAYAAALGGFSDDHAVFIAAVRQAANSGHDDIPWRIASQMAGYFEVGGHWRDWLEVAELACTAATRSGDHYALGVALHTRSWPLRLMRRLISAVEDAVAALHHLDLAGQQSAGPAREIEASRGDVLSHLGTLYRESHRYDEALACLDEAVTVFQQLGDRHGEGLVLRTLGHVQFWRRDLDGAHTTLNRAVSLLAEVGDTAAQAWSHNNLGSVLGAQWREQDARAQLDAAIDLFNAIEHRQGAAWALNHGGRIARQYGRIGEAIESNRRALEIFQEIGDQYGTGSALLHLGAASQDEVLLQRALETFADMDVPEHDGQGWALIWLARLRHDPRLLQEAQGHFELIGSLQGQGTAWKVTGDLQRFEQPQAACDAYQTALTYLERAHDPHQHALALLGLAALTHDEGDHEAADVLIASARGTLDALGAPEATSWREGS
jgi:tetratricopeptide (TPR) repeat protein